MKHTANSTIKAAPQPLEVEGLYSEHIGNCVLFSRLSLHLWGMGFQPQHSDLPPRLILDRLLCVHFYPVLLLAHMDAHLMRRPQSGNSDPLDINSGMSGRPNQRWHLPVYECFRCGDSLRLLERVDLLDAICGNSCQYVANSST